MSKSSEVQSVSRSLGILAMTLLFIYVVFFGMHGESFVAVTASVETGVVLKEVVDDKESEVVVPPPPLVLPDERPNEPTQAIPTDIGTTLGATPISTQGRTFFSVQELFAPEVVEESAIIKLRDEMRVWEGYMKSLHTVGLQEYARYILKDMENTHYVYLGNYTASLEPLITQLGGNVVEITGETSINKNQLFGDKVQFINLPSYADIKVLMLVFFYEKQDVWFIQIDKDTYYANKTALAETFDLRYTW